MQILTHWMGKIAYIDDDGRIRVTEEPFDFQFLDDTALHDLLAECGYINPNQDSGACDVIIESDGKTVEEVKQFMSHRVAVNRERTQKYKKAFNDWAQYLATKGDCILAIDQHIDSFQNGFHIYVSMRSSYSRREQAEYIRTHREEFVDIIQTWFRTRCRNKKYKDLFPFCRITEVTVTNQNEAKVTLELKEELLGECRPSA